MLICRWPDEELQATAVPNGNLLHCTNDERREVISSRADNCKTHRVQVPKQQVLTQSDSSYIPCTEKP